MRVTNMVDLLRTRADTNPDAVAYAFLESGEHAAHTQSWSSLDQRSRAIGAAVATRVDPGARVLIMLPPGIDFASAFFGVLYAGAIAIPTYPPAGARADRTSARVRGMVADAGVSLVLSHGALRARVATLESMVPELVGVPWLEIDGVENEAAREWRDPGAVPSAIALLQYTSGSTAAPRGVMVSHTNLLHNLALSSRLGGYAADSVSVSWLPVNHDMGLINGVLQGVHSGCTTVQMAPAAFLQRPARWLQAVSRFGATHSGGPNFAYDLCARRVSDEDREGLDLSSWRLAYNGSEPVRRATMEHFTRVFGQSGFRTTAFRPGYGLAESTLLVTSDQVGAPAVFHSAGPGRPDLQVGRETSPPPQQPCAPWVSAGAATGAMQIRIVDPVSLHRRDDGEVGEIWVAGESVALGYWNKPVESAATFRAFVAGTREGPFLRTGDLGCIQDGHLFVTGRIKDVLIVRGLKHYPHDIESTAEQSHPALRPGCCAAFAVERAGEERVAMVAEVDPRSPLATDGTGAISAIRRAVADAHQVSLHAVALVPAGSLPKTTSGKLQRFLCRGGFIDGTLGTIAAWDDDAGAAERIAS
ncbi:MAG TPA: fatty acyl-AMP ligase [Vicinamibacterales bacterium]|nr:fatty acyl-AMP ligase [Vicinamibacterales bacterium]